MFGDLKGLPEHGVDVNGALIDLGAGIAALTRNPTSEDPPAIVQALLENQLAFESFRSLYHSRPYFDKIDYCERLINYLVGYACKGEISAKEAASMFRNIATSELPGETPALSLARIFALLVLKHRECPRPEIALALQGLQFFSSSYQVLALLPPSPPLTSNSNSSFSICFHPAARARRLWHEKPPSGASRRDSRPRWKRCACPSPQVCLRPVPGGTEQGRPPASRRLHLLPGHH